VSLRVLHVITRLTLGGSSENTLASIVALQRAGYDVALAVSFRESDPPSLEDARRRGVRLVDVPGLGREVAPLRDLAALRRLRRIIAAERPHVVHTHTSKAGFVGRLAARLTRVPAVIHQPHGHVFYGYWGPCTSAFFTALERRAARWSDRIVTLTDRGIEEHLARGIGRRAQYVSVPSGVPIERLRATAPSRGAARAHLHLEPAAFVVAGLGRLVRIKGFDLLVEALPAVAAAVPTARLVLIGDGPERAALEARATALGVAGRLAVTGAVDDVTPWLAVADVVAAPSRNEGMGRALVEAMALGIPVVGAAVGGIPSVIADGECGRLVPPEDAVALARALVELGRDAGLRTRLGAAAVARAEEFSSAVADRRMGEVYATLAREKRLS
jgi:glycosyltransferase involved in cell wall biosynthesis